MGVHMLGDQRCQHLPELVGDLERAGGGIGLGGWASTLRTWPLGVFRLGGIALDSLDATLRFPAPATPLQGFNQFLG